MQLFLSVFSFHSNINNVRMIPNINVSLTVQYPKLFERVEKKNVSLRVRCFFGVGGVFFLVLSVKKCFGVVCFGVVFFEAL